MKYPALTVEEHAFFWFVSFPSNYLSSFCTYLFSRRVARVKMSVQPDRGESHGRIAWDGVQHLLEEVFQALPELSIARRRFLGARCYLIKTY